MNKDLVLVADFGFAHADAMCVCVCVYSFSPEGGLTLFEEHWAS